MDSDPVQEPWWAGPNPYQDPSDPWWAGPNPYQDPSDPWWVVPNWHPNSDSDSDNEPVGKHAAGDAEDARGAGDAGDAGDGYLILDSEKPIHPSAATFVIDSKELDYEWVPKSEFETILKKISWNMMHVTRLDYFNPDDGLYLIWTLDTPPKYLTMTTENLELFYNFVTSDIHPNERYKKLHEIDFKITGLPKVGALIIMIDEFCTGMIYCGRLTY